MTEPNFATKEDVQQIVDRALIEHTIKRRVEQKEIALATAHEVLKSLGIFAAETAEPKEFRRDFAYLRAARQASEKIGWHVRLVIIGAVAIAALGAFTSGILSKIGI